MFLCQSLNICHLQKFHIFLFDSIKFNKHEIWSFKSLIIIIINDIVFLIIQEKKCNSEEILNIICPPLSTNCVEDGERNGTNGTCECIHGIFNPKYTTNENYCLNSVNISSQHQKKSKFESSSQPHFIIIIISLVFVSIVIGCIFVYKKLHMHQRLRNIRRTHCRSFYEINRGNDDDPPLI